MPSLRRGDFISGLALAALGAFILQQALAWEYSTPDGPGAGFYPRSYGIAMIVLSLALVVRSVREARANVVRASGSTRRALVCWAALVGCILLTQLIGFLASLALLCWLLGTLLFAQRQRYAILLAILTALGFWLVFDLALGVALPRGSWGL